MARKNAFNTVTSFSKITALVLFVILPVISFYLGVAYQERLDRPFTADYKNSLPKADDNKGEFACTMEAKICPDGSSVGRTGPNCEFEKCPGE